MQSLEEQRISALPNKAVQNKPILCPLQLHFFNSFLTWFIAVLYVVVEILALFLKRVKRRN